MQAEDEWKMYEGKQTERGVRKTGFGSIQAFSLENTIPAIYLMNFFLFLQGFEVSI